MVLPRLSRLYTGVKFPQVISRLCYRMLNPAVGRRPDGLRPKVPMGTLKSRERTSRDLTTRHHIARVDIVRLDNARPYRKGGHRET